MPPDGGGSKNGPNPDRHVLRAQEDLWAEALRLAAIVESALDLSVTALCHHRPELADSVKASEREIDRREVAIERECLRILALYEPVASDFRRMLTVLRINRDLERIGDLAARIAKRSKKLALVANPLTIPEALEELAEGAVAAVRAALDALVKVDAESGRIVIAGDRRLDQYRRTVREGLKDSIKDAPGRVEEWLLLLDIARHLERVGDHASGIAQAVVYLKEGQIIRRDGAKPEDL